MNPIKSLDQIRDLLRDLPAANEGAMTAAKLREVTLVKPPGALGRLEELSEWLSGWQGHHPPKAEKCQVAVFVGSHGVTAEGVSAFPAEVTEQMVEGFKKGAAAINQLCQIQGCELKIYEVAIEIPTRNFMDKPAMEDDECAEAMAFGMSAVEEGLDVLCLGEMGIGNTTAAAAICHALYGQDAEFWVGPGWKYCAMLVGVSWRRLRARSLLQDCSGFRLYLMVMSALLLLRFYRRLIRRHWITVS